MRFFAVMLLLTVSAFGQTSVPLEQLKKSPGSGIRLVVILPDGLYRQVELGDGISVVDGKLTVSLPPASPAMVPFTRRLSALPGGNFVIPAGTESITVNGLMVEEGEDYTIAGDVLTPKSTWYASWMVVARGRAPRPATPEPRRP